MSLYLGNTKISGNSGVEPVDLTPYAKLSADNAFTGETSVANLTAETTGLTTLGQSSLIMSKNNTSYNVSYSQLSTALAADIGGGGVTPIVAGGGGCGYSYDDKTPMEETHEIFNWTGTLTVADSVEYSDWIEIPYDCLAVFGVDLSCHTLQSIKTFIGFSAEIKLNGNQVTLGSNTIEHSASERNPTSSFHMISVTGLHQNTVNVPLVLKKGQFIRVGGRWRTEYGSADITTPYIKVTATYFPMAAAGGSSSQSESSGSGMTFDTQTIVKQINAGIDDIPFSYEHLDQEDTFTKTHSFEAPYDAYAQVRFYLSTFIDKYTPSAYDFNTTITFNHSVVAALPLAGLDKDGSISEISIQGVDVTVPSYTLKNDDARNNIQTTTSLFMYSPTGLQEIVKIKKGQILTVTSTNKLRNSEWGGPVSGRFKLRHEDRFYPV